MSKIERSSGDPASAERRGAQPTRRDVDQHAELYELAYEESKRALDDQKDELTNLRDRTVQFVIFIGAATAFLVGSGLQTPHRDNSFFVLAGVASAFSIAMIWLLYSLLSPSMRNQWHYRFSADELITHWIESEVPRPSKPQFVRALAKYNDDSQRANEKLLTPLRYKFRVLIAVGSFQIVLWASLVWWKG